MRKDGVDPDTIAKAEQTYRNIKDAQKRGVARRAKKITDDPRSVKSAMKRGEARLNKKLGPAKKTPSRPSSGKVAPGFEGAAKKYSEEEEQAAIRRLGLD